jgi:hypothetical protein
MVLCPPEAAVIKVVKVDGRIPVQVQAGRYNTMFTFAKAFRLGVASP